MKKEFLMKLILIVSIVAIVALTAVQVFAEEEDPFAAEDGEGTNIDLTNQYQQQTQENENNEDNGSVIGNLIDNSNNQNPNTNPNTNTSGELAKAGTESENLLVGLIITFAVVAIFAYIKVRTYKNI